MSEEIIEVPCPICRKAVIWTTQSPFRPFCSKRCQLIDLGEWAAEEKAIPSDTADFATDPNLSEEWRSK
ncbi:MULTISPECIES: DNA gyrase inhibitor YacG [unclassified Pasteurella]|uniref:DNA gyrase inhibitor YacG n=1 Tax=unclassified Pasteurella TaxID=2621516 RepID=UPI001072F088|nr:DNA gyrase inhibitor YacG [Pasteurella sp. 19428wF3_WM03]TFU53020.1 DNA gyrase inhibitor YacG [Pasteurella sp. WM03]